MQPSKSQGGATICSRPYSCIRFCFGIGESFGPLALVCWQISCSMTAQAPRRRPTHLCADDELTLFSQLPCRRLGLRKKISTLLGGPFHSGAPRLCLPCLPCRDATGWGTCPDAISTSMCRLRSLTNECRLEEDEHTWYFRLFKQKSGGGDISYVVPTELKSGGGTRPPVPHRSTPMKESSSFIFRDESLEVRIGGGGQLCEAAKMYVLAKSMPVLRHSILKLLLLLLLPYTRPVVHKDRWLSWRMRLWGWHHHSKFINSYLHGPPSLSWQFCCCINHTREFFSFFSVLAFLCFFSLLSFLALVSSLLLWARHSWE